jgi:hypothetical protein
VTTPGKSQPTPSDPYASDRATLTDQLDVLALANHEFLLPSWKGFFAVLKNAIPTADGAQLAQIRIVVAGAAECFGQCAIKEAVKDL